MRLGCFLSSFFPTQLDKVQNILFAETHLRNTVKIAGVEVGPLTEVSHVSPMWGRVGGDREFPCLPHPTPNTDKSLVPAGPGQEGRTKAGQRLHSSSYDPFTLVSNLW